MSQAVRYSPPYLVGTRFFHIRREELRGSPFIFDDTSREITYEFSPGHITKLTNNLKTRLKCKALPAFVARWWALKLRTDTLIRDWEWPLVYDIGFPLKALKNDFRALQEHVGVPGQFLTSDDRLIQWLELMTDHQLHKQRLKRSQIAQVPERYYFGVYKNMTMVVFHDKERLVKAFNQNFGMSPSDFLGEYSRKWLYRK